MTFLAFLVLLSAIAISACGAYFSIIGLKLLFVGGGISIIVMGAALEIGKIITATFLKQKWNEIGFLLKTYLIIATIFLMGITSIGIYGYLSAGYTATSIVVQGYEQQIASNTNKVGDLEKEISNIKQAKYNETEIASIEDNRKKVIDQRTALIGQRHQQIDTIRKSSNTNQDASIDIAAAKQALEISKSSTDADISRELEQIKLYNDRLVILDKEIQKWMDEGSGGLFKKNGLDKARLVKEGQAKERNDIDVQIKASQERITKLREQYNSQVKAYNDRVSEIESRSKSQRTDIETNIKNLEKDISDIEASISSYNKEMDDKISALNNKKGDLVDQGKKKIAEHQDEIQKLRNQNTEIQEKIVHTDVGTFKFIANSLGIPLDKAVNYFIWSIMAVFDPLAVCLILAFNVLIMKRNTSKVYISEPTPTDAGDKTIDHIPTPTITTTPTTTPTITPTPTVAPTNIIDQTPKPTIEIVEQEASNITPPPPPPPSAPHGIVSGKVSPR